MTVRHAAPRCADCVDDDLRCCGANGSVSVDPIPTAMANGRTSSLQSPADPNERNDAPATSCQRKSGNERSGRRKGAGARRGGARARWAGGAARVRAHVGNLPSGAERLERGAQVGIGNVGDANEAVHPDRHLCQDAPPAPVDQFEAQVLYITRHRLVGGRRQNGPRHPSADSARDSPAPTLCVCVCV